MSAVGTQMTTVAMAWQMYELTGSPLQVGFLGLGRAIPQIGFAVFGGLVADAMDRRQLMRVLQVLQLTVSAGLGVLTLSSDVSPAALYVGAALFALGSAGETPIRQAVVPNLVPRSDLGSAIALTTMERSLGLIVGPGLAGVAIAVFGPGACYLADAFSWLAMLVSLALIRVPLQVAIRGQVSLSALAAGIQFVWRQPVIFPFMILDFGATLFGSSYALLPIYAKDILDVGPIGLGALYAAPSVGGVIMGAALSGPVKIDRAGVWVLLGVALYGLCTMVFAVSTIVWLSLFALAGTGAGNIVSAVLRGTSNQLLTPDELRGRVAAVNSAFVTGGPQLGQFESGLVAAVGSAQLSAFTGGLGALALAGGLWLLPRVRSFRFSSMTEAALST